MRHSDGPEVNPARSQKSGAQTPDPDLAYGPWPSADGLVVCRDPGFEGVAHRVLAVTGVGEHLGPVHHPDDRVERF